MGLTPLVCLPFAGAGASFFYPWIEKAGAGIEIVSIQLPGREWRLDEQPYQNMNTAADELFLEIAEELESGRIMFFGHSLGAVLAYELAHRFCIDQRFEVIHLIVSGSPGPWTKRTRRATGLPDHDFIDQVSEFAQYNAGAMNNPEFLSMILPALRADVKMHEEYVPSRSTPLAAPITSLRGSDDQLVAANAAAEWSTATGRAFALEEVPGGHMYVTHAADGILRIARDAADQRRHVQGHTASAV